MASASLSNPLNSNYLVENQLHDHLLAIEKEFKADALTYIGPIESGADDAIRELIESIKDRKKKLCVLLETEGGYAEVAQRIANIFRRFYAIVDFIVPNFAFSAGTILVMSGDAIHMDYYGVLGPIDTQVPVEGRMVAVLGYLKKYNELIDKAEKSKLNAAELHYLVRRFDPAELYTFEQADQLSTDLLKEWLVKYKFKNWKKTETRKKKVTLEMKRERAEKIATVLRDTTKWRTHNRGISMDVLRKEINLVIDDFGENAQKNDGVRKYGKLLQDYMSRRGHQVVLHVAGRYVPLS